MSLVVYVFCVVLLVDDDDGVDWDGKIIYVVLLIVRGLIVKFGLWRFIINDIDWLMGVLCCSNCLCFK